MRIWTEDLILGTFSGDLAFDIGAQTGGTALMLKGYFNRIVSVEPAEESFPTLCAQNVPGLIPVLSAVGDHDGTIELAEQPGPMCVYTLTDGSQRWGGVDRWRTVPCTTIDSMMIKYGPPELIKIDTEGWELSIVKGGVKTLTEHHPNLYIEIHHEENGSQIQRLITDIYGQPAEIFDPYPQMTEYYWLVYGWDRNQ